jgi:hypothetical protein
MKKFICKLSLSNLFPNFKVLKPTVSSIDPNLVSNTNDSVILEAVKAYNSTNTGFGPTTALNDLNGRILSRLRNDSTSTVSDSDSLRVCSDSIQNHSTDNLSIITNNAQDVFYVSSKFSDSTISLMSANSSMERSAEFYINSPVIFQTTLDAVVSACSLIN